MAKLLSALTAVCAFTALILFPDAVKDSAYEGILLCGRLIIPSLFPFFVVTSMLSELGIARALGRFLSPMTKSVFGVSGLETTAFIIGVSGGYPVGASFISDLRKRGDISREKASEMLVFCNNSGPAFIIGAVGIGVFHSSAVGLLLYLSHILAAVSAALIFKKTGSDDAYISSDFSSVSLSEALTSSVKRSVAAVLSVCGYVVSFSVFTGLFDASGLYSVLTGRLSELFGLELHFCRALLSGIFELGNGIGCMDGLSVTPLNLALSAFLLGWGGLSVHCQTFSAAEGIKLKTARYIIGRFGIAILGAATALLFGALFL